MGDNEKNPEGKELAEGGDSDIVEKVEKEKIDEVAAAPVKKEKEVEVVGQRGYISKSMLQDRAKERKGVYLVTFATSAAAASYVVMVFIAMPLSIHTIINLGHGCDPALDDACFAPIDESQRQLTLTLTSLRVATFLMGSLLGTLSDRFGRKPLLIMALLGYTTAGACFLIGWGARNVNMFVVGAIVLGASSPVIPHGVAYVSDVSLPNRLAVNMGILEGFGYFIGLMCGALLSLAIGYLTTGQVENLESYEKMFYGSYACGLMLSLLAALMSLLFLPESLHPDDRTNKIDWKKANPLGFLPMVTRRPYFFMIWLTGVFAWCSIGSQESANGGWWLRRYAISDSNVFILYVVLLWVSSGIGAAFCTKLYVVLGDLKFAIHVSAIMTIVIGIIYAMAPTVSISYMVVGLSFFASSVLPTTLALLMGQVDSREKGALAGAVRSSEALAKFIGIIIVGNSLARYIAPFTPDSSCIPADFAPNNKDNDCDCGVNTCPVFDPLTGAFNFVPSECNLGLLTQKVRGKPSKFIDYTPENTAYEIYPQLLIDGIPGLQIERPDDCLGAGLVGGNDGLTTNLDRAWCITEAASNSIVNGELGCVGFDLSFVQKDLAYYACAEGDFDIPEAIEPAVQCTAQTNTTFNSLPETYVPYHPAETFDETLTIFSRVLNPDYDGVICGEGKDAEYNLCIAGPISSIPGYLPLFYMGLLSAMSYGSFLIAEFFFIKGDARFWKTDEDVKAEEEIMDVPI